MAVAVPAFFTKWTDAVSKIMLANMITEALGISTAPLGQQVTETNPCLGIKCSDSFNSPKLVLDGYESVSVLSKPCTNVSYLWWKQFLVLRNH